MENFNRYLKMIKNVPFFLVLTYFYGDHYEIYEISSNKGVYNILKDKNEPLSVKEYTFKSKLTLRLFFKAIEENLVEIVLEGSKNNPYEQILYQK